ncbi:RING-H2 finger protein ATL74-like [Pyrus x bretschneideri]|uniref:RING-H2 finger protein ATL74-like n=1 Tax=Pyrus x bretschneideri TaxID=225117 RepID=UPI0005112B50|nr:RING-H2 finger protein ATL74-like [Pyrus x bretschneideri]
MHRYLLGTEVNTAAPLSNGRAADSYVSEAKFDTNMVIILAALLCALICALGLNSFVRCALRCSRRFALETPEQVAEQLAATGLKKKHLRQIPIAVYGSGVNIPATECPICLAEFEDGEKVRVLPKCHHGFHVRCIDTWLLSHSSCPNCRHSLLSTSSAVAAADSNQEANAAAEGSSAAATNESSQQGGRVVVVVEQGS